MYNIFMENKKSQKQTQVERTKRSKKRIVQEATRLFGQKGYSGTRLSDIAEAAGLTLPGLLHHFPNKESVLFSVLENRDKADQERYETLFQNEAGKGALNTLHSLVQYNQTIPELMRIFTVMSAESTDPDHPGHTYFVNRYRYFRRQYLSLIKEAQGQGRIRADINIEQLGLLVMAMMDGLQLQWLLDPEQVDMAEAFDTFRLIFERGLQEKLEGDHGKTD